MTSMQSDPPADGAPPPFTFPGIKRGLKAMLPLLPGIVAFSAAFGAVAAQKQLTLFDATLMSAIVFAGVSQLVAMEIWTTPMTWSTIGALMLATMIVNMRMLLSGASVYPWLGNLPVWQAYPTLLLLTDANWLRSMRYRNAGGKDAGFLFGSGLLLWLLWVPATSVGYIFGSLVSEPRRYAIDLILPIYFVAMIVPLWRGPRRAVPWVIAGAVALTVQHLVPGFWFIIAGALSGAVAGGFIDDRK